MHFSAFLPQKQPLPLPLTYNLNDRVVLLTFLAEQVFAIEQHVLGDGLLWGSEFLFVDRETICQDHLTCFTF